MKEGKAPEDTVWIQCHPTRGISVLVLPPAPMPLLLTTLQFHFSPLLSRVPPRTIKVTLENPRGLS